MTNQQPIIRRLIYSSKQIQSLNLQDLNQIDLYKELKPGCISMKHENEYLKDSEENEVFILGYN